MVLQLLGLQELLHCQLELLVVLGLLRRCYRCYFLGIDELVLVVVWEHFLQLVRLLTL